MTCKDCIHYDVCGRAGIPNPEYKGTVEDKSKTCKDFKEKDYKQTPKKVDLTTISKVKAVDVETKEIYTYPVVRCPSCDKPMTLYKERKFCENCGQALERSDD